MFGALFGEDGEDGGGSLSSTSHYVEPPQPPRAKAGLCGLDNQGATCYLNSLLQVLFMSPEFRKGIYDIDPHSLGLEAVIEEEELEKKEALLNTKREVEKAKKKNEVVADSGIVAQLCNMGCAMGGSKKACIAVNNSGVDAAMDYYFSHADDEGFNDDIDDKEDDEVNEGGKGKVKKSKVRRTVIELQRLFTQLQLAEQRSLSTDLLTSKGFNFKSGDASVQHDVQELIVMLLDKLDHELGGGSKKKTGSEPSVKLIPSLFELTSRTELECLTCGATSGPPPETNKNFFVPIKGFNNMSSALGEVFLSEVRRTDCDACGAKRDKSCSLAVHKLPPLLWCSLMRFDFDWQKQQRTKINDEFEFPLLLDMRPHVPERAADQTKYKCVSERVQGEDRSVTLKAALRDVEAEIEGGDPVKSDEDEIGSSMKDCDVLDPLLYDLVGVVLHNGSGYSGHYVSLIRDQMCESQFQPDAVIPPPPRLKPPSRTKETKESSSKPEPALPNSDELQKLTPVELLRLLLSTCSIDAEKGTHVSTVDNLATLVHKHSGRAWGKMHKRKCGTILNFVKGQHSDFYVDEASNIALISQEEPSQEVQKEASPVKEEDDGWTSVTKKGSKDSATSVNTIALEEEKAARYARGRKVACLSAQRWGRWFQFNDSSVSPIPLHALSEAFEGRSSAYMLLYRSRGLGPLRQDMTMDQLLSETIGDIGMESGESPLCPPAYWSNWIKQWNSDLEASRKQYEASSHAIKVTFVCPGHASDDKEGMYPLHLVLKEEEVPEVSSEVSKPFLLDVDVRSSVADLREKLVVMMGRQAHQLGIKLTNPVQDDKSAPSQRHSASLRLHVLTSHGPGYILSSEVGQVDKVSGYAAVVKDAGMTCGDAFGPETEVTVLCWDGKDVKGRKLESSGVAPLELFVTKLNAAAVKKKDREAESTSITGDYSKLVVRKVVGGGGKTKPSPLVEVATHLEPMFVSRYIPTEELVVMIASKYDIPADRVVLHIVDSNDKITLFHSPNVRKRENNKSLKLDSCNKCELMVEDIDARGFFTQSLAETELLRRKRKRTVHVLNLVPPPAIPLSDDGVVVEVEEAEAEEEISVSFGSFGDDDEDIVDVEVVSKAPTCAAVGIQIEVDCEGEVTVLEFRKQLLKHLGLSSCEETTRLKFSACSNMSGEVLSDESLTLQEAKVETGTSLNIEIGARAKRGEVTLKFKVKNQMKSADNVKEGVDELLEVTVKETATVCEVKDLMCDMVGLQGPHRLRFTNWAEEEGVLVAEIDESVAQGANGVEKHLNMKEAGLVGFHEFLLLEEGHVPRKGELHLHLLLWNPPPERGIDAGGGDGASVGEGGAVASSKEVRGSCLKSLFALENAHVDQPLTEFKQDVANRLTAFVQEQYEDEGVGSHWRALKARCECENVTELFELRMLRSDLLPGKWLTEEKTLGKLGLKSGSPILIIPKPAPSSGWLSWTCADMSMAGEMQTPTLKALDIFVTRRKPPVLVPREKEKEVGDKVDSELVRKCLPLDWPPLACSIEREEGFHSYDELRQRAAQVAGVELEHALIARHDFGKCSWSVLSASMKTKKQSKSRGKVVKGGARNVCQAPFSVKPGDLIGVLDKRDLDTTSAPNDSVASEYLMTTAFDTTADVEGRAANRLGDKRTKQTGTAVQKKRVAETVLDIGNFNWDDSDGEESD